MKISDSFASYKNSNNKVLAFKQAAHTGSRKPESLSVDRYLTDDFVSSRDLTVSKKQVNILGGSKEHLESLGVYLMNTDDETIRKHVAIANPRGIIVSKKKNAEAYKKLMPYVRDARARYQKLLQDRITLRELYINSPSSESERLFKENTAEIQKMVEKANSVNNLFVMDYTPERYWEVGPVDYFA